MNKLIQALLLVLVGLAVLAAATPALTKLAHAAVPLIVTAGVVVAALRVVWAATRRW
ncbi:MAG TPA: hypothetical protein VIC06_03100 [Solirubrobacteraceae bacterium]